MKQIKTLSDKLHEAARVLDNQGNHSLANAVLTAADEFNPGVDLSAYTEKLVKFGKAKLPLLEK